MEQMQRRVAVIGGVRIPFCRSNTFYADKSNLEMLTGTSPGCISTRPSAGRW
jgi:acetyl-CoA C-acetyltransferase